MARSLETRERYFIVTAGRTGSTLLSSLLAEAGADFGMPASPTWDETEGGAFEHPAVVEAAGHFRASYDLAPVKPTGPRRWLWAASRHLGKRRLGQALKTAHFVKAVNLDLTIQTAFTLGYFPRIILSHRCFSAQAISLSQMYTHRTADVLEADYLRTYRNGLMYLYLYGGCVVGYDELTDPAADTWLAALGEVTGTDPAILAAARQPHIRPKKTGQRMLPILSRQSDEIFLTLQSLSGQVIAPSTQALRNWTSRRCGSVDHCAESPRDSTTISQASPAN